MDRGYGRAEQSRSGPGPEMEVLTGIGLGWRSRVCNGWTKSEVLTSNGYRSWTTELDQGSG